MLFVFCCQIPGAVRSLWIDKVNEWTYTLRHLLLGAVTQTFIFPGCRKGWILKWCNRNVCAACLNDTVIFMILQFPQFVPENLAN
jgi:hypothetical protein